LQYLAQIEALQNGDPKQNYLEAWMNQSSFLRHFADAMETPTSE